MARADLASTLTVALSRALLVLLALCPLVLGGTTAHSQPLLAILALAIAGPLALLPPRSTGLRPGIWPGIPLAVLVIVAVAAWTLLRASSLGASFGPAIVQEAHALWPELPRRGLLVPAQGGLHALKLLAAAAVVAACAIHFGTREGLIRLARVAIIAAALTLAVGLVQDALNAQKILFFYQPLHRSTPLALAGPFVNPNQAGAVLGLGATLLMAAAFLAPRLSTRISLGVLAALPALAALQLDARGATGALLLALLTLAGCALAWRLPSRSRRAVAMAVVAFGVVAFTAIAVYWVVPLHVVDRSPALQRFFYKTEIWHGSLALLSTTGPFGTGPLSFADLYPGLPHAPSPRRHSFVEAAPLQVLFDHGWIAGGLLIAAVVLPFVRLISPRTPMRSEIRAVVWATATFVAAEAITGMGQQSVAYTLLVASLLGAVLGQVGRPPKQALEPQRHRDTVPLPRWAVATSAGALTLVALVHTPAGVQQLLADREMPLYHEIRTYGPDHPEVDAAMLRHAHRRPGEGELVAQATLVALARGEQDQARKRLEYMVQRLPAHPFTPRIERQVVRRIGTSDERCRLARAHLFQGREDAIQLLQLAHEDPALWTPCVPDLDTARQTLGRAAREHMPPADQIQLALAMLREDRDDPHALSLAAHGYHAFGLTPIAVRHLDRLNATGAASADDETLRLRIALAAGDIAAAIAAADRRRQHDPRSRPWLARWLDLQLEYPEHADPRSMVAALPERIPARLPRQEQVQWWLRIGDTHRLAGNTDAATRAWENARQIAPESRAVQQRLRRLGGSAAPSDGRTTDSERESATERQQRLHQRLIEALETP